MDLKASVAQLQLRGLRLMADQPAGENAESNLLFSFDQLDLEQIFYDAAAGAAIATVTLGEPVLSIVRQAVGEIARFSELLAVFASEPEQQAPQQAPQQAMQPAASTADPMTFAINRLQVMSTNFLALEDESVTPPVNLQLNELDLLNNDINSGSTAPMTVQLSTANNNMQLGVTGDVGVFTGPMAVNLMVNVSALDLPRFSPYIPGYNINRGRLSVDSEVAISGEMLDIQNSVLLEAIQLAGKAADDNTILAQGMAMPLDVALDLLRDSDDQYSTGPSCDREFVRSAVRQCGHYSNRDAECATKRRHVLCDQCPAAAGHFVIHW